MRSRLFRLAFGIAFISTGCFTGWGAAIAQDAGSTTTFSVLKSLRGANATPPTALEAAVTIAVTSDLHVRDENLGANRRMVKAVNDLAGVSLVAVLGDLCEKIGTEEELARVKKLVAEFVDPVLAIPGNHDFMYRDSLDKKGDKVRGTPAGKKAKLERFRQALKQKALRFSRKAGGHLLVFLPIDELDGKPLAKLSDTTLTYFRETLEANPALPTIVFCHAPLKGSYERETDLGSLHGDAQPAEKIHDILADNPQVFLWVAGHLHIRAGSEDYHSDANKVGKVTGIHVAAIKSDSPWIRTIRLTPESAVVRTFDTDAGKFLAKFDRTFRHKAAAGDSNGPSTTPAQTESRWFDALQKRMDALLDKLDVLREKVKSLFGKLFEKTP